MSTPANTIPGDPLESAPVLVGRPDDVALTEGLLRPVLEPVRKGWAARLLALLAGRARTPRELARELFPSMGTAELFLTLSETVANLEVLEARGEARRVAGTEPWRYAP